MSGFLRLIQSAGVGAACLAIAGCGASAPDTTRPNTSAQRPAPRRLTGFGSEAELRAFLQDHARRAAEGLRGSKAAPPSAAELFSGFVALRASPAKVTNVQHAGVDEGDIVKVHGEHLVVLRRGRLFTLRLGDDRITPVSMVDAFAPDLDPSGAWYDEILVADGVVVVIGYSYARGGTELALFDIDRHGRLSYRATYHLRSNDYYSSRNYASRLLGRTLVFYTPLFLSPYEGNVLDELPAMRRWHRGATASEFVPIHTATRLYRPLTDSTPLTLHTVITCDLARRELTCSATGVMGPPGRVFYVAPDAVYVWMTDDWRPPASWLYRLPFSGAAPGAVRVEGAPVDQFSFLEDADYVNVLVRSGGAGDGMWQSEVARGDVALLRLPRASFGTSVEEAPAWRYRPLPAVDGGSFQNRFVAGHVLYGSGSGWGPPHAPVTSPLYVYDYVTGAEPVAIALGHAVDRIEALGDDAIVVGADARQLHFSSIRLGSRPALAGRYTRSDATQGELRSHGFFYRADARETGIVGLPVRAGGEAGYRHLVDDSASVLFLRNDGLVLRELGELRARRHRASDDACRASCVDWYGNARPLFIGDRIFGLLGYEIVEGGIVGSRLEDRGRLSFAPDARIIPR